jgi:hypothetical protein
MIFGEMPRTRPEADASTLNGRSRLVMKSPEPGEADDRKEAAFLHADDWAKSRRSISLNSSAYVGIGV